MRFLEDFIQNEKWKAIINFWISNNEKKRGATQIDTGIFFLLKKASQNNLSLKKQTKMQVLFLYNNNMVNVFLDINFKYIAKKSLLTFSFHIIEYFFKVSFNFEEIFFNIFHFNPFLIFLCALNLISDIYINISL